MAMKNAIQHNYEKVHKKRETFVCFFNYLSISSLKSFIVVENEQQSFKFQTIFRSRTLSNR